MWRWIADRRYGRVLEVRSAFLHSSDLDPGKPINWKRRAAQNGEYGVMGDLGMHALHLPLRAGWFPKDVRAILSDVVRERPDGRGGTAPCDTWDNALLLCEVEAEGDSFPLRIETKRIAPGETNTWIIEVDGTEGSIAYTTKQPKTLRWMEYEPGGPQAWSVLDLGSESAYPSITGAIFEFGFSDAILQMWAAFLDELAHGRDGMAPAFHCATPEEAAATHRLFTAALESQATSAVVPVSPTGPSLSSRQRRASPTSSGVDAAERRVQELHRVEGRERPPRPPEGRAHLHEAAWVGGRIGVGRDSQDAFGLAPPQLERGLRLHEVVDTCAATASA